MKLPVLQSRVAVHEALPPMPTGFGAKGLPALVDARERAYSYLRLSVTDRCDLACVYCMPPSGEDEHALRRELLSFEEASRIVEVAAAMGIKRVRLTGGEPLVRRDIVNLVDRIRRAGVVENVVMTTNATRLAELARPLADAGLSGVNVSLDSLDPDRFRRMTRGGELAQVLAGVHAALDVGFVVKLNVVVVRGENDAEVGDLVDFAWAKGITPRFIELMPLGEAKNLGDSASVAAAEIEARLGDRVAGSARASADSYTPDVSAAPHHGPARYRIAAAGAVVRADGTLPRVGFITPLSGEFCDDCNRIRITARGDVRACLASRRAISLRDLMREGATDTELAWALHAALGTKLRGHEFLDAAETEHTHVGMSLIGG